VGNGGGGAERDAVCVSQSSLIIAAHLKAAVRHRDGRPW